MDQHTQAPFQHASNAFHQPAEAFPAPTGAIDIAPPQRVQPALSPTERTVLHYLLQGMTERQVASELDRSHNTVHVHVRNIYRKVGVTSRKMLFHALKADPSIIRASKRA